jgi:hypothetical protein
VGRASSTISALALLDRGLEVGAGQIKRILRGRGLRFLSPGADPRVLEQIADELLHPLDLLNGVPDELPGRLVELVGVPLGQELDVARHDPEGLL